MGVGKPGAWQSNMVCSWHALWPAVTSCMAFAVIAD